MASYLLSSEAEQDLRELIRFTKQKWGNVQVVKYREVLKNTFELIVKDTKSDKLFTNSIDDLFFCKAGAHYVFFLRTVDEKPLIIAILHPRREILKHLRKRL
jgi:plasmid stabilization system protein ParE